MRKLVLVVIAIAITAGAYAQVASTTNMKMKNQNLQYIPVDKSHPDGVTMQNGKMMMVKNGQMTSLDHDMTLSNGTKVMSDGSYIKKDGTKMMMKERQHLDMSGNMVTVKTNKGNNVYVVPDSTRKIDK